MSHLSYTAIATNCNAPFPLYAIKQDSAYLGAGGVKMRILFNLCPSLPDLDLSLLVLMCLSMTCGGVSTTGKRMKHDHFEMVKDI